jgi:hypothetical protein
MKRTVILTVLCGLGALIFGGCAIPPGDDFTMARDTDQNGIYIVDYDLQRYVPAPVEGQSVVTSVATRGDLEAVVTWKDKNGTTLGEGETFRVNTEYQAEIKLTPRPGYLFNPAIPFSYHSTKIQDQNDDRKSPTRTVTVRYNTSSNSSDRSLTYIISDYNLQNYVPVPAAGENPVRIIHVGGVMGTIIWKDGAGNTLGDSAVFQAGEQYTADITLQTKPGYQFDPEQDFVYPSYMAGAQPDSNRGLSVRSLSTVTYQDTKLRVTDLDLKDYVLGPVAGETPGTAGFEDEQYTASEVRWEPVDPVFVAGQSYTATVTLNAKDGYGFIGGAFTHNDGVITVVNSDTDSITLEIAFTQTQVPQVVTDLTLSGKITRPVIDNLPNTTFVNSSSQYTGGVVTWYIAPSYVEMTGGAFLSNNNYTARVTLSAERGYTFTGVVGPFIYTANNMSGITTSISGNTGDTVTVDIRFPELTRIIVGGSW